jgi:hypothetical protein
MAERNTLTEMSAADEDEFNEELEEIMNILSKQYDELLALEAEENPQGGEIGWNCGFPCDGQCSRCAGAGTFDLADE